MNPKRPPVTFAEAPALWDIEFSDAVIFDRYARPRDIYEAVTAARTEVGVVVDRFDSEVRVLYTDDQLLIEKLKERLYEAEVAYVHYHIPKTPQEPYVQA